MTASVKYDTTGNIRFGAGVGLSDQTSYITANTTAPLIFPRTGTLPTTRVPGGIAFVYNSTAARIAFHSSGTTWLYANITSVLA